jgi:hypothetical protein
MEVNGQLHAPAVLPLWKEPPYPLDTWSGWVPEAEINIPAPDGNITPVIQPVA